MANPKAPPGGFKQGGWYEGRHYWDGKFGAPGVVMEPGAAGFGKRVSSETLAQTSVAAGLKPGAHEAFISSQYSKGQRPTTQEQVTPYLNQFQGDLFKAQDRPSVKVETMEELGKKLKPEVGLPPLLKRADVRAEMMEDLGVAALETSLTDIKDQIEAEMNLIREQRGIEEGKPVAMGVISGRITEEERVAQQRVDFLGRQQARVTDELNTKYTIIGQYMQDIGLDYNDAVNRYDTEFKQNVQMYNIILGQEELALTQYERDRTAARANLQIYTNAITSGNINYAGMSTDQKLMVSKLEVQSGFPVGFIGSLQMSAKDRLLSVNDKTGEALIMGADGKFQVVQTGMRITPTGGDTKPGTDASARANFLETSKTIKGQSINGTWVGEFPLLVQQYAPAMDLKEIYRLYNDSELGKEYGSPGEDPIQIRRIYDRARGEEE